MLTICWFFKIPPRKVILPSKLADHFPEEEEKDRGIATLQSAHKNSFVGQCKDHDHYQLKYFFQNEGHTRFI